MKLIAINDIGDGIAQTLTIHFPEIEIHEEELNQGLEEPCFFIKILQGKHTQELGKRYRRVCSFDIQYFNSDKRALQDMAEQFYDVMELINLGDAKHRGVNMKHETTDGVLHFFVDYNFILYRQGEDIPKMQELKQEGYVHG